jgi:polyhydroxyalkanoic acid synthase PhaR subunit
MADEQAKNGTSSDTIDPMDLWREMRDASMSAWSKAMIETVNTDAYAQTSGAVLENWLTNSAPFRSAFEKTMLMALEQCSMPSRNDFISLADRLTNVETRLDDMDAKLDRIEPAVAKTGSVLQKQVEARLDEMHAKLNHIEQVLSKVGSVPEKQFGELDAKLNRIEQALSKTGSVAQKQVEKQFVDLDAKLDRIEQSMSKTGSAAPKQAEQLPLKKQKKGDF